MIKVRVDKFHPWFADEKYLQISSLLGESHPPGFGEAAAEPDSEVAGDESRRWKFARALAQRINVPSDQRGCEVKDGNHGINQENWVD